MRKMDQPSQGQWLLGDDYITISCPGTNGRSCCRSVTVHKDHPEDKGILFSKYFKKSDNRHYYRHCCKFCHYEYVKRYRMRKLRLSDRTGYSIGCCEGSYD
jgi:hypothetical protein